MIAGAVGYRRAVTRVVEDIEAEFRASMDWARVAESPSPTTVWSSFLDVVRCPIGALDDYLVDGDVLGFTCGPSYTRTGEPASRRASVQCDRRLGLATPSHGYEGTFVLGIVLGFNVEFAFARAEIAIGEPGDIPAPQPDVDEFRYRVESSSAFAVIARGQLVRVQLTTGFA